MNTKAILKQKAEILKGLREQHKDSVEQTQALVKNLKRIEQQICQAIRDTPKTVPEISKVTGMSCQDVLWHVTALKKYGRVMETGMCGDYYLYQRAKEIPE